MPSSPRPAQEETATPQKASSGLFGVLAMHAMTSFHSQPSQEWPAAWPMAVSGPCPGQITPPVIIEPSPWLPPECMQSIWLSWHVAA